MGNGQCDDYDYEEDLKRSINKADLNSMNLQYGSLFRHIILRNMYMRHIKNEVLQQNRMVALINSVEGSSIEQGFIDQ